MLQSGTLVEQDRNVYDPITQLRADLIDAVVKISKSEVKLGLQDATDVVDHILRKNLFLNGGVLISK